MPSFFWLVARHIPSHFPQPRSLTHAQSTSCLWLYVFLWSFWCWQPFCSCAARRRHRGRLMVSVLQLHVYHFFTMSSNQDCCLSLFHRSNPWLQKHKGTVYFYLLFLLSLLTMCTIFFLNLITVYTQQESQESKSLQPSADRLSAVTQIVLDTWNKMHPNLKEICLNLRECENFIYLHLHLYRNVFRLPQSRIKEGFIRNDILSSKHMWMYLLHEMQSKQNHSKG